MSRKRVRLCLLFICGCLCLLLLSGDFFCTELTFSRESGFYEEPFALELSAPLGAKIYYTLDGSEPDENAILYTAPIFIEDATPHPNVYSMRTDTAYGFTADDLQYELPDYPVDKCTVVRAAYQDVNGTLVGMKTESYFVGYDAKAGYTDMNVISIVTDPDHLFDYDTGIYVFGRKFDLHTDPALYSDPDLDAAGEYANFSQHGPEWERPADIQMFNRKRETVLKRPCGIRIQGGGSRGALPKSLNLYARENYGRESKFYTDLFGTGYMADTITLTAGGQDSIAKFRDMFVSALTGERDFCTMHYEPCVMFLDGEYWGVYWLTERYNDTYIAHYYHTDEDNVLMVKNGKPTKESDEDWSVYNSIMHYLTETDFSVPANYEALGYTIDIQSYLDYYATEIYIARGVDWPGGTNEAFWRARNPLKNGGEGYEDGRWRWMLFDVNTSSLNSSLIQTDSLRFVMEHSPVFQNLCRSDEFKEEFTVTLLDLVNETFAPSNTEPLIADYLDLMTEPLNVHYARFFGQDHSYRLEEEIADIRNFLENRKPCITGYLKEDFGLEGVLAPVEIETTEADAGSIVLNTITPTFDEQGKWRGEYFTDYPISLSAEANEGYRFAGWEVKAGQSGESVDEASLTLAIPESGLWIKAVFEEEEE